ncbi:hypothetical protein HN011_010102 [Eciton burchellii]|nr:hypothetical protein HN011_010102 [Eciton burchellii]
MSPGVKSVVPFAGYIEILRESHWIKPRLSGDDPAKWSRSDHESIRLAEKERLADTNQISRRVLSRYLKTLKFAVYPAHVEDSEERSKGVSEIQRRKRPPTEVIIASNGQLHGKLSGVKLSG